MSIAGVILYEIRCNTCDEVLRDPDDEEWAITCESIAEAIAHLAGHAGHGWIGLPDGTVYCPEHAANASPSASLGLSPRTRVLAVLRNAARSSRALRCNEIANQAGLGQAEVLDQLRQLRALGLVRHDTDTATWLANMATAHPAGTGEADDSKPTTAIEAHR